ncbi:hypothetical protein ABDJ41_19915 [Pedobacter sp. ASV1-7]|uniref:hypothetical protein n=1 Tax=Pedobacter sp. ASV1-7 TaxID=3145237 RepID=UPI0032E92A56
MMISKYTHPAIKQPFLVLLLGTQFCFAQTKGIPDTIKSAFEGTWQSKEKHYTNTVKIYFEPKKDYALFTDIGTGVAPTKTFKVQLKGNLLVLPAVRNQNDCIEMEIIKGRLYLRSKTARWDEKGNIISSNKDHREQRVFKRVKK